MKLPPYTFTSMAVAVPHLALGYALLGLSRGLGWLSRLLGTQR